MKTTSLSHDDYQQMKRGFPALSGGKAGSSASRAGSTSSSSLSRKLHDDSAYDPVARTGLLPAGAQTRGFDGLKTYVVGQGGGASSSLNLSRRLGMVGGRAFEAVVQPPGSGADVASRDSNSGLSVKEKQKKRAREEREMREMLRRDGGKSLGAKYLVRNGKAKISTTDTEAKKKRRKEDQSDDDDDEDSQEEEEGTATEDSDTKEKRKRKRVFDVKAVRKIGWDPSLIGDASSFSKAKPKVSDPVSGFSARFQLVLIGVSYLSFKFAVRTGGRPSSPQQPHHCSS